MSARLLARYLVGCLIATGPGLGSLGSAAEPSATSTATPSADAQRDRIRRERSAAQASFVERERECQTRFIVTACIEAAKRDQRDAMAALQAQQRVLDEADRKRRAVEKLESLNKKASDDEAKPPDAAGSEAQRQSASVPRVKVRPAAAASAPRDAGLGIAPKPDAKPEAERRIDEARNTSSFEARQKAAQEHREAVNKRNAELAKKGAPLLPPAASSP